MQESSQLASHDSFQPVVRLAGWNDSEPGTQIILGHEDGVWRFQSTEADWPEVPQPVAGDLVAMFVRAVAGTPPAVLQARPIPVDRNWLVEGFGISEVVRFDTLVTKHPQIWAAAMCIYKVHQLVVAGFLESVQSFPVLMAVGSGGAWHSLEAKWSANGFVYRVQDEGSGGDSAHVGAWSVEDATSDLATLLPSLDSMAPVLLHPVAAWELVESVLAMQAQGDALSRQDWLVFVGRAIQEATPSTLMDELPDDEPELLAQTPEVEDSATSSEIESDQVDLIQGPAIVPDYSVDPHIVGRLASITSEGEQAYRVRFVTDVAGESRVYEVTAKYGDGGVYFSSDDEVQRALAAMGIPPLSQDLDAYRLYAIGHLLDELFGRITSSGILEPLMATLPDDE